MDNELILFDRLNIVKDTINKYSEENFYISFSGGKDSTALHYLVDMALPGNKIPRVFSNTGIEYQEIVNFVKSMAEQDDRIVMLKPSYNIKDVLNEHGYPFKSKKHSFFVDVFDRRGLMPGVKNYLGIGENPAFQQCPKILKYQFEKPFASGFKISDACCTWMKEKPLDKWAKENNKPYTITGLMREEGGRRAFAECISIIRGKISFNPFAKVSKDWENWFIDKYDIKLCSLYYEPYNFTRTGCKGCPFALNLEQNLETIKKYFPNEYKQCMYIWQPVYDEYKRIGYRLHEKTE